MDGVKVDGVHISLTRTDNLDVVWVVCNLNFIILKVRPVAWFITLAKHYAICHRHIWRRCAVLCMG